ncbi:MAG TPA: cation-binding protein, partial [Nitrospiraceae bacterium]|nr:cation-binding protein [Nitrospiraceae bacterium]
MRPIGSLMVEHRVIERMLGLLKHELTMIIEQGKTNGIVIDVGIDFFSTYVAKFHHRKEEEILFRELEKKPLSEEDKQFIDDLIKEHVFSRDTVEELRNAHERCATGTKSPDEIVKPLEAIIKLYPLHIEKEDSHFFFQTME